MRLNQPSRGHQRSHWLRAGSRSDEMNNDSNVMMNGYRTVCSQVSLPVRSQNACVEMTDKIMEVASRSVAAICTPISA